LINSHWVFCGLGLLLLIMEKPPENPGARAFDYGVAVLAGLTGPFCLIYAPLFALKAWFRRDRRSILLLGIIVVCCIIQMKQLHTREFQLISGPLNPSLAQILSVLDQRFLWMFTGYDLMQFHTLALPIAALGLLAIMLLSAAILRECVKNGGYEATVPLFACILVTGATFFEYRSMPEALIGIPRYFFIPIVTFLWALVLAAHSRPLVFVPLLVAPVIAFLSHPSWSEYDMKDLHWAVGADCLKVNPDCKVRIHPLYVPFSVFSPSAHRLLTAREIEAREKEIARSDATTSK
jgi:hypothetical protein